MKAKGTLVTSVKLAGILKTIQDEADYNRVRLA